MEAGGRAPGGGDRAAIFGGTFDPFHNGHLRMAIEVRETFSLSRVILLPAAHPPHKPAQPVSDARHRLEMARMAAAGLAGIVVSDLEIRREGPSYSVVTIRQFQEAEPAVEFFFVLGTDAFAEVTTWHRHEEFLASCDFILIPRRGVSAAAVPPGLSIEKEEPHCYSWVGSSYRLASGRRLFCPALPALDISSRSIREKVREGKLIRGLVPPETERYIAAHGLYSR